MYSDLIDYRFSEQTPIVKSLRSRIQITKDEILVFECIDKLKFEAYSPSIRDVCNYMSKTHGWDEHRTETVLNSLENQNFTKVTE